MKISKKQISALIYETINNEMNELEISADISGELNMDIDWDFEEEDEEYSSEEDDDYNVDIVDPEPGFVEPQGSDDLYNLPMIDNSFGDEKVKDDFGFMEEEEFEVEKDDEIIAETSLTRYSDIETKISRKQLELIILEAINLPSTTGKMPMYRNNYDDDDKEYEVEAAADQEDFLRQRHQDSAKVNLPMSSRHDYSDDPNSFLLRIPGVELLTQNQYESIKPRISSMEPSDLSVYLKDLVSNAYLLVDVDLPGGKEEFQSEIHHNRSKKRTIDGRPILVVMSADESQVLFKDAFGDPSDNEMGPKYYKYSSAGMSDKLMQNESLSRGALYRRRYHGRY